MAEDTKYPIKKEGNKDTPIKRFRYYIIPEDTELESFDNMRQVLAHLKEEDAEDTGQVIRGKLFEISMEEKVIKKPTLTAIA